MNPDQSLQERYAPRNFCFGCGPSNPDGLQIRSFEEGDEVVCDFTPQQHHRAFDQVLNGGILGTLMDCHSNWTATMHLMRRRGEATPPCTVTADYAIKMLRPTPADRTIQVRAKVVESTDERAKVEARVLADGQVCATCVGNFVAVKPGHPAYHRW